MMTRTLGGYCSGCIARSTGSGQTARRLHRECDGRAFHSALRFGGPLETLIYRLGGVRKNERWDGQYALALFAV